MTEMNGGASGAVEQVNNRKVGRPGIVDEFSALPVSRQRKWQLRQMAKGGCRICGQAAISKGYCLKHLVQERDHSAQRFGYQRQNLNCKSRLLEKFVSGAAVGMTGWKHHIVSVRDEGLAGSRTGQDELIERWGLQGWELTGVVPQPDGDTWLYFKHPLTASALAAGSRPVRQDSVGVASVPGSPLPATPAGMPVMPLSAPAPAAPRL